jgi:mannose-6-phosphate isomerase-like protein (cupin superfamily)
MSSISSPIDAFAYAIQPEEAKTIEELHVRLLATGELSGGAMTVLDCTNPGPGGPPLHVHRSQDECYYVIAGRYRFKFGEREYEGGPGTFAYAPRGTVHTFASVGPEQGRLLAAIFPAGLEHFLEALGALDRRGAGPEEYEAVFREYDSEIVGPPLG